jgi:hypothetical protein
MNADHEDGGSFMHLLRGLQGMQVRWRTLGASARGTLDRLLFQYLMIVMSVDCHVADIARGRVDLITLVVLLGQLKVAFVDLSPSTQALLIDSVVHSVHALPPHLAIADVLYAMGSMGVVWADLPTPIQHRLKSCIYRYLPRPAQRGRAWRGLYGLAEMGVRWQTADVKLRGALEG